MRADKDDAIAEFLAIKEALGDSAFKAFQSRALADSQNDFQVLELLCVYAKEHHLAPPRSEFERKAALLSSFPLDTTWFTVVDGYPVRLNGIENSTAMLKLNELLAGHPTPPQGLP